MRSFGYHTQGGRPFVDPSPGLAFQTPTLILKEFGCRMVSHFALGSEGCYASAWRVVLQTSVSKSEIAMFTNQLSLLLNTLSNFVARLVQTGAFGSFSS